MPRTGIRTLSHARLSRSARPVAEIAEAALGATTDAGASLGDGADLIIIAVPIGGATADVAKRLAHVIAGEVGVG